MISFNDKEELKQYIENNVLFTSEVAEQLDCTRQYIYKIVTQGLLIPFKVSGKERLFLKEDVDNFINRKNKKTL